MIKKCPKCTIDKYCMDFYTDTKRKDGLSWSCKVCKNLSKRLNRLNRRDIEADRCAEVLAADRRIKYLKSRPAYLKAYSESNKDRLKVKQKEYAEKNKEKIKAYKAAWNKNNPHLVAMNGQKRRKIKKLCTPTWTDTEWELLFMSEIYFLSRLRKKVTGFDWHVDHKVPLISEIVCGLHWSDNMQLLPAKLNLIKSNVTWENMFC
jgi:hypothetical protein